ncbi:hypothetical protein CC78DRAFT_577542 [Lojkania enalia]|uniref:Uncharacterized protein n=1 Tax=Lojkania enalia TaxID=147567 RepID=A0A9P4KE48_9PLEO|nr:hypothetical protein CC78DRAFT_577542 [Didymosphaeria enalia]
MDNALKRPKSTTPFLLEYGVWTRERLVEKRNSICQKRRERCDYENNRFITRLAVSCAAPPRLSGSLANYSLPAIPIRKYEGYMTLTLPNQKLCCFIVSLRGTCDLRTASSSAAAIGRSEGGKISRLSEPAKLGVDQPEEDQRETALRKVTQYQSGKYITTPPTTKAMAEGNAE